MILLAEDDDATRDAIALVLECEGLSVQTFPSCDALCGETDPLAAACLLLDVHMAGTTGLELLERLNGAPGRPPIILMSGNVGPDMRMRAAAAGAFALIEKPFRGDALIASVQHALGRAVSPA